MWCWAALALLSCEYAEENAVLTAPPPVTFEAETTATSSDPPSEVVLEPDASCLERLENVARDGFVSLPSLEGVRTPVRITQPLLGLSLHPRGRQAAVMDCELALALAEAQPFFAMHGIESVSFSAAYHLRQRRDGSQLSSHSYGLAIDVHTLHGQGLDLDVVSHFERGVGLWKGIAPGPDAKERCIGHPSTTQGRTLRELICALKLETRLSIIVTPDDNSDHRDHFHLEVVPAHFTRPNMTKHAAEKTIPNAPASTAQQTGAAAKSRGSKSRTSKTKASKPAASRSAASRSTGSKSTLSRSTASKSAASKSATSKPTTTQPAGRTSRRSREVAQHHASAKAKPGKATAKTLRQPANKKR